MIYRYNKNQEDALIYSQFISIINLYIFGAGLLLIIRILPTASQPQRTIYTNCCIYRVVPPDDEQ